MGQSFIVILLADHRRAMALAEAVGGASREVRFASGTDELHRLIDAGQIDLLIIEDKLPGFFRGIEILERLQDDLLRPAAILLIDESTDTKSRASKAGIEKVLPRDAGAELIASAVDDISLAKKIRRLRVCPVARQLVREQGPIQPLPQLLLKLAGHLHREEISPAELAKDISLDSSIAAELLRLTNSSAWGRTSKAAGIPEAVAFLGVQRSISLILSVGLMRSKGSMFRSIAPKYRLWHNCRSVLTASVAAAFAANYESVPSETAYILGLLQDVGMLVFAQLKSERYEMLLDRVREIPHLRIENLEKADFQTTHADVSAALLQRWGLPDVFAALALEHHEPENQAVAPAERALLHCMQIGEAVANFFDNRCRQRFLILNRLLARYAKTDLKKCRATLAEGISRAVESCQIFQSPLPPESALAEMALAFQSMTADTDAGEGAAAGKPGRSAFPMPSSERDAGNATEDKKTVLVIEDEPIVAELIGVMLKPFGLRVIHCDNQADALLSIGEVETVVCDVHLDGESGIDIVRAMRAAGFRGRVIMASGDSNRKTVHESIKAGINGFLVKPFSQASLLEKVSSPQQRLEAATRCGTPGLAPGL
jgi:HD-like signal output (HDOD) protein/DNA-binding response OmpR family regulator